MLLLLVLLLLCCIACHWRACGLYRCTWHAVFCAHCSSAVSI
jgi:hypothetical protein